MKKLFVVLFLLVSVSGFSTPPVQNNGIDYQGRINHSNAIGIDPVLYRDVLSVFSKAEMSASNPIVLYYSDLDVVVSTMANAYATHLIYDPQSLYDGSTGSFTVPVGASGFYRYTLVSLAQQSVAPGTLYLGFYKNNSLQAPAFGGNTDLAIGDKMIVAVGYIQANTGDVITMKWSVSAGTCTMMAGYTSVCIERCRAY